MNKGYSEEDIKALKDEVPLGRIGEPEDIAKCVKWLVEDNYTTGQVITIDGRLACLKSNNTKRDWIFKNPISFMEHAVLRYYSFVIFLL